MNRRVNEPPIVLYTAEGKRLVVSVWHELLESPVAHGPVGPWRTASRFELPDGRPVYTNAFNRSELIAHSDDGEQDYPLFSCEEVGDASQ